MRQKVEKLAAVVKQNTADGFGNYIMERAAQYIGDIIEEKKGVMWLVNVSPKTQKPALILILRVDKKTSIFDRGPRV